MASVNQGGSPDELSPRRISAAQRQAQALQLRVSGATLEAIAKALGYSHHSGAQKAVQSALKKMLQEPAEELRKLESLRLDTATLAISQQVRAGNFGAVDRWVRLSERRSKLLGLDKPIKIAPTNIEGTESYDAGLTADQLFEKLMANFNGAGEVGLPEEAGRGEAPEDSGAAGA
jgi:uncharacterized protein YegP (UPF0339 family)